MSEYKPIITITAEQFENVYVSRVSFDEMKARAEAAEERVNILLRAVQRAHNILYASRTTGVGKYGGNSSLAALDAENILFDILSA